MMRRIVRSQITRHRLVQSLAWACFIGVLVASQVSAAPATEQKTPSAAKAQKGNEKHSLPGRWRETGAMSVGRFYHTATLLPTGQVLVLGGAETAFALAELYDPTANGGVGAWRTMTPLKEGRDLHAATVLSDGTVLVVGGGIGGASIELYDPAASEGVGASTVLGQLKHGRYGHTATLMSDGKVLIVGGKGVESGYAVPTEVVEVIATNGVRRVNTSVTSPLQDGREYHTATLLSDGTVLVVGGVQGEGGTRSSAELYDPKSGAWSDAGELEVFRIGHTAVRMSNGMVLVAGGEGSYGDGDWDGLGPKPPRVVHAGAQLYAPSTNHGISTWKLAGHMKKKRAGHTATLLNDKVLIAGGNDGVATLSSAELYDTTTNTRVPWMMTGSLKEKREAHTATLLPTGAVLVVGGRNEKVRALTSAEIYEPMAAK